MPINPVNTQLSKKDLCFLDTETTGSIFGYHEIIEIGAVRTSADGTRILAEWHRKIAPQNPDRISDFARKLTGYNSHSWNDAHDPNKGLWLEFVEVVTDCVPVCHNPSFDRAFITLAAQAYELRDLKLDYHWIGTESLGWPLYKSGLLPKLSLADLCSYLGVKGEPTPHTALEGAHACQRVYVALMNRLAAVA